MKLSDLFPGAMLSDVAAAHQDVLVLPLDQGFLHLPKADLTEREKALIQILSLGEEKTNSDSSWLSFLQGESPLPIAERDLQLIYWHHPSALSTELKRLLTDIFSNSLLVTELSAHQSLLVLDASDLHDSSDIIKDLLPTIEGDFGLSLKAFIGNAWTGFTEQDLQVILSMEYAIFQDYHDENAPQLTTTFAQALLWSLAKKKDIALLSQKLLALMDGLKDGRDLVIAMWQEHGNLVQTAQRLFIHRNSLQYRLDKFHQVTGLNLKDLDDLALAYLLILKN
ncbi:helix-turn-helix domain-containing protein [Streptococcus halotolerans]|uniref:helix-turn-helix domain-containing protein n=1 Tax=Streptococcus halotolerans TaxID=1814128 RepID=UPI000786EF51|nr:helix-turn-helix domain-containing protein [Streptococcus halotolerans]